MQIQIVNLTQKEETVRCRGKVWYIIRQNFVTILGKEIRKIGKISLIENWRNVRESWSFMLFLKYRMFPEKLEKKNLP